MEDYKYLIKQLVDMGYEEDIALNILRNDLDKCGLSQTERDKIVSKLIEANIKNANLTKYY